MLRARGCQRGMAAVSPIPTDTENGPSAARPQEQALPMPAASNKRAAAEPLPGDTIASGQTQEIGQRQGEPSKQARTEPLAPGAPAAGTSGKVPTPPGIGASPPPLPRCRTRSFVAHTSFVPAPDFPRCASHLQQLPPGLRASGCRRDSRLGVTAPPATSCAATSRSTGSAAPPSAASSRIASTSSRTGTQTSRCPSHQAADVRTPRRRGRCRWGSRRPSRRSRCADTSPCTATAG